MTLKFRLGVTQDHWKWHHSKAWYGFIFAVHSNYGSNLRRFGDKAIYEYWSKIAISSYPLAFHGPVWVPVGILP